MLVILENEDCKKDGDLSEEEKKKLEALNKAKEQKKVLEEVVYESFILASNVFKEVMQTITQETKKARIIDWTEEELSDYFNFLKENFFGEYSTCRLCLIFILTALSYKPEVVWLDEAAEALTNCAEGLRDYMLDRHNCLPSVENKLDKVDVF